MFRSQYFQRFLFNESWRLSSIKTTVDVHSPEYKDNFAHHTQLIDENQQLSSKIILGGPEEKRQLHLKRNRLLARDRIQELIDPGSSFLELSRFAGYELYDNDSPPAGGLITGVGMVEGTQCMIMANDPTVKGGTYYPITVKKHIRAQTIAQENRLPCLYLVDSGGAFLPRQDEIFPDREHFGRLFFNQANMSAQGIPQISIILGPCTAGGSYIASVADLSIIVREQGTVFLAGPPLVKAAIGQDVTAEELGGALVHCTQSGVTDYMAENDSHALFLGRQAVRNVNWKKLGVEDVKIQPSEEPLYPAEEILGILPKDNATPYEVKEIIARLVDGSKFDEYRALYGTEVVTGWAHIHGLPIGIIANNGVLDSPATLKATNFIELCNQRATPILFLQNISGFMVGKDAEAGGIAKDGAKLVNAVSTTKVPKFTVIIGGGHGAGFYGMCGRSFDPRFLFSWPNSKISVMSGTAAASVLAQVKRDQLQRKGIDWDQKEEEEFKAPILAKYEKEGHPHYAAARLWNDGIISPLETRKVIAECMSISMNNSIKRNNEFGVFRM